jgi:dolichol-phosphate mannosyltransferase
LRAADFRQQNRVKLLLSHHFNLTVELPLKCIIRGYRYTVLPNSWKSRKQGASKLRIKEMGSRYLFIILYLSGF